MKQFVKEDQLIKSITLSFASIEIYEDYIVSTINEGIVFDTPHLEQLHEVFLLYFADRPFGYISNQQNDYTVNPICYIKARQIEQMVGMAVWCHTERNYQTALFTKPFFPTHYEPFFEITKCVSWIQHLLRNQESS